MYQTKYSSFGQIIESNGYTLIEQSDILKYQVVNCNILPILGISSFHDHWNRNGSWSGSTVHQKYVL